MNSSPDVSAISNDSLFLIAKATELFVQYLATMSFSKADDQQMVDYKNLSKIVDEQETLQFLQDIIPQKIKYKEFLTMLEKGEIDLSWFLQHKFSIVL